MKKVKYNPISIILIMLMMLYMQLTLAEEQPEKDNTYLHIARDQLSIAIEQYNDGDIHAAKKSLKKASDWLDEAVDHSEYDTIKTESERLAYEIDSFRHTLSSSSEQTDLVRFWHQVTSLITSESERLIHRYIKTSNDNTTLKHLLDAKMHFFLAEHDLFVGHESKDALHELNDSLEYLDQAKAIARQNLKTHIDNLIGSIKELRSRTESSKKSWKQDELINSLDMAISSIKQAETVATPPDKLKLKLIEQNIHQLKLDMQKTNLKTTYDSIMADFIRLVKSI